MHARELLDLQRTRPFPGLRIHVSDGASYDVMHPEMMTVTSRSVFIALPPLEDGLPTGGSVYCDPVHITRVEPIEKD